jgi:preprotein translocase subunit YajC
MEIMGVVIIIILGIIFVYIWRADGQMHTNISKMLENIAEGQKEIAAGQKEIAQMLLNQTKILERIESRMAGSQS